MKYGDGIAHSKDLNTIGKALEYLENFHTSKKELLVEDIHVHVNTVIYMYYNMNKMPTREKFVVETFYMGRLTTKFQHKILFTCTVFLSNTSWL